MNACKIVALGGGTGLSTMLRGLKRHTSNLTAVVTMSDNGGGSGVLRNEMNMLPPGDIRNCILALANTEPILEKLFQYRFCGGSLEGQSFGNIFLAALNGISGSFESAVEKASEVLAVTGQVLPVTLDNVNLCAIFNDNSVIEGETEIVELSKTSKNSIKQVFLKPSPVKPYKKVLEAIIDADLILLGPGSLYTSIIPNLLVEEVVESIIKSKAKVVYISNIMTQPGETEDMNLQQHIDVIEKYLGSNIIDFIIANNEPIPKTILDRKRENGAKAVDLNIRDTNKAKLIETPLIKIQKNGIYIRHNEEKLASIIMTIMDLKIYN